MGNQGMTNWKFSAFLAIALMLIAGLFTNAAMAADGDGAVTGTATATTLFYPAGATEGQSLEFIYTVDDANSTDVDGVGGVEPDELTMEGGLFQLDIPRDWIVDKSIITVTEDGSVIIYRKGVDFNSNGDTADDDVDKDPNTGDDDAVARVTINTIGDNVSSVVVNLDDAWADGSTLTILFGKVTVPNPSGAAVYNC